MLAWFFTSLFLFTSADDYDIGFWTFKGIIFVLGGTFILSSLIGFVSYFLFGGLLSVVMSGDDLYDSKGINKYLWSRRIIYIVVAIGTSFICSGLFNVYYDI